MNYTTEQVIDLYNQYQLDKASFYLNEAYNPRGYKIFIDWLKDKEQSELPVKGQMIWVRDSNMLDLLDKPYYVQRHFVKFTIDGLVMTYCDNKTDGETLFWDEYSLTDPNK